jgi:two-component system chemotaxis response regulator CheV
MPNANPYVEGIFKPRDIFITVIDLPRFMGLPASENPEKDMFMVTSFNKTHMAFHVHTVEGLHRISWEQIEKPDPAIYGGEDGLATGITKIDNKIMTIVDFEHIVFDISPESGIQLSEITNLGPRERSDKPVVTADDSVLLNKMILEALHKSGYNNTKSFPDGQAAWDYMEKVRIEASLHDVPVEMMVAAVITDIEMPKMDGHNLTKRIKEDQILKKIPVILFSSLIDSEMRLKGIEIGADAQLSKPEIGNLVSTLDGLIL